MCKHVLYVLILFPTSSFSITGCPPPTDVWSHVFLKYQSYVSSSCCSIFANLFLFVFIFAIFCYIDCFASHKTEKKMKEREKRKSKEREKERVSDSGQSCPTQGASDKVGVMCVLAVCFDLSFSNAFTMVLYKVLFFDHRTFMAAPPCVFCPTQGVLQP